MASSQNSQQSSVRDNRAFRLRAGQLSAKTRPPGTWAPTSAQPGMFGTPERCPPQSLPPAPPMLTPDHSPIRRVPGVKTSRNTSPAHSLRTGSSACSLPNRLKKRSTVILRTNIGMQEAAKRKFNKLPPKPTASFNKPKLVGPSTKLGPKADASGRKPHQRIIALNRLKAVDAMHKRLQALQSELFAKIRALGDDAKDLDGVYKFVTMVVNDECKLVAHSDDMRALPPTLPAESINDLKDRCRAVIDMGFVTFYDAMSSIQLCKTEWEARIQREDLRSKLGQVVAKRMKSIIKQIDELCSGRVVNAGDPNSAVYKEIQDVRTQRQNAENRFFELKQKQIVDIKALRAELEVQMTEEIGLRDHQISELQAALRRNEQEVQDLSEMLENKNTEMSAAEDTIEKLNAELREIKAINETIQERLEEADAGLLRATKMINNNDTAIEYLNSELKDAREFIVQLQKSPDALDPEEMVEKDQIIADLKLKLKNFEQHKSLVEKQVTTAVMQMSEYDELNGKFQVALTQMNDLKDKLRVSTAELDKSARTEQHLRKDILKLREQSERDQKMLSMRSDLINTLQESERDAKKKLEEMYSQSNEKDSLIDQVNNMLVSKEEEFRCVFGTLTYKQRELRRQEHIIQLLEDQQSRTSMMRTKQDERNAAMQEEIVNLKQTIQKYAKIIIGNNGEHFYEVVSADEVDSLDFADDSSTERLQAALRLTLREARRRRQRAQQSPNLHRRHSIRRLFEPLHRQMSQQLHSRHHQRPYVHIRNFSGTSVHHHSHSHHSHHSHRLHAPHHSHHSYHSHHSHHSHRPHHSHRWHHSRHHPRQQSQEPQNSPRSRHRHRPETQQRHQQETRRRQPRETEESQNQHRRGHHSHRHRH